MKLFFLFLVLFASKAFAQNSPNLSANTLFLYQHSNLTREDVDTTRNGFDLQEAEIALYSDVDPYHRLNILLAVGPEYEFDATTSQVVQSWKVEPEAAYAESLQIPGITLKLGKFKAALGKHNQLHTHAFPFVNAPIVNSNLLGDEGLNDVGVSVAGLIPISWFSEVTLQFLRGEGENEEFNSPSNGGGVGVLRWSNLFDLSDEATLEMGVSGARGDNYLRTKTQLGGFDLTYKWRPMAGGKYYSLILAIEALRRTTEQPGVEDEIAQGGSIWGQYQFAQRWNAALRLESFSAENSDAGVNTRALPNEKSTRSALSLSFLPTEFSSYRLELGQGKLPPNAQGETDEKRIFLQANFTIGAHPAHAY